MNNPIATAVCLVALVTLGCQGENQAKDADDNFPPEKIEIVEGKGLLVACNATESPDVDVWWVKNSTTTTFRSDGLVLRFNTINRMDAGEYVCYSNDTTRNNTENATLSTHVNIDVLFPAEVMRLMISPNVVQGQEKFVILGWMVGNPGPNWRLYINETNRTIASATGIVANFSLNSDGKTCVNAGTYILEAANRLNTDNSTKSATVEVLCKPELDMTYGWPDYNVKARLGHNNASLEVHTLGDPDPTFTWTKVGSWPQGARQIDQSNFATLAFDNVTVDAFGDYYLNVSNNFGSMLVNMSLIPTGRPETPSGLQLVNFTHNSMTLTFYSGYDYGSPQHFYVMKMRKNTFESIDYFADLPDSHGHKWIVHAVDGVLTPETVYNISIEATNNEGPSWFSNSVAFKTLPDPNPHSDPFSAGNGGHVAIIAGPIAGGLTFLGVLALMMYLIKYRRKKTVTMKYDKC